MKRIEFEHWIQDTENSRKLTLCRSNATAGRCFHELGSAFGQRAPSARRVSSFRRSRWQNGREMPRDANSFLQDRLRREARASIL